MIQRKRFGLSAVQKGNMWRRWKAGQSLHEIGRAFGKERSAEFAERVHGKEFRGNEAEK